MLKVNPPNQRYVANTLNCSILTVNKVVNPNLKLEKAKKYYVHRLSQRHMHERRTLCRYLCEKHLSGEK